MPLSGAYTPCFAIHIYKSMRTFTSTVCCIFAMLCCVRWKQTRTELVLNIKYVFKFDVLFCHRDGVYIVQKWKTSIFYASDSKPRNLIPNVPPKGKKSAQMKMNLHAFFFKIYLNRAKRFFFQTEPRKINERRWEIRANRTNDTINLRVAKKALSKSVPNRKWIHISAQFSLHTENLYTEM